MPKLSVALNALKFRLRLRDRLRPAFTLVDALSTPATATSGLYLRALRRFGIRELPLNRAVLSKLGVFPVQAHYYEPFIRRADLRSPLDIPRDLPGIDLCEKTQLDVLRSFEQGDELARIPVEQASPTSFGYANGTFGFADAAWLYSAIRTFKPRRILEVGSGNSTLLARLAVERNAVDGHLTEHVCIEPYEMPWLEGVGVRVIRQRVEECPLELFLKLERGDILFIDSSHVIRPQGDVLHLYQRILPRLPSGVLVHVHDIFTPRDYPEGWLLEKVLMWDEQYLLESFLTFNDRFEVIGALHALYTDHFEELATAFPFLRERRDRVPMSFWMRVR